MVKIVWEIWPLQELKKELPIQSLEECKQIIIKRKEKEKYKKIKANIKVVEIKMTLNRYERELSFYFDSNKKAIEKILNFFTLYTRNRRIWFIKKDSKRLLEKVKILEQKLSFKEYSWNWVINIEKNYYGALWEEKVVNKFKNIYSPGILINNFDIDFDKPIFTKWWKDIIMSMQIDHIFISERWVFLIETKNWNSNAENNWALSPIKQAELHNHAFYFFLKGICENDPQLSRIDLPKIFNAVVFTGKYKQESTNYFIKSIRLNDIKWFIENKKIILSPQNYRYIADILIKENQSNTKSI